VPSSKRFDHVPAVRHALFAAVLAAAMPAFAPAARGQVGGRDAIGADDLAAPLSRDPGDLMNSGTMVYVDDSFASVEKLRTAIRYANQGQSQLAINAFQDIVANYGQKLVLLNDNSYVSITDYVRERLLAMPAVKSGMYDQLYGLEARREIDAALDNRDVAALIRVSDRYFPAAAALKGLAQAAEWYFERGEFAAAAQTWRLLLTHPLAGDRTPEFLFRAALAEHLAGSTTPAAALRDRLARDFPDASGALDGKQARLLPALDGLLAQPAWEMTPVSDDEWPAFDGGPSRSLILNTNAAIGAKLWSLPIADAAGTDPNLNAAAFQQQAAQQRAVIVRTVNGVVQTSDLGSLASYPVLSGGTLFVHLGRQVVAISANAGTRLWTYPAQAAPDSVNPQGASGTAVAASRLTAHDSVTVYGDQVFAVLPQGGSPGTSTRYVNGIPILPTRLVCLRRDGGTEVWSRSSAEIKLDKEGSLSFVGSPLVTRQGVFVMARKTSDVAFTQQYLVRLDRDTGEPTWTCYLCSTSNANGYNYSGYNAFVNVPIPTLVDDILYVSTGQGADCAVDANVGRILWLRVTAPKVTAPTGPNAGIPQGRILVNGGIMQSYSSAPLLPSWQYNPPLIVGDKMITTDSQVLRIYDRWTGRLLKAWRAADLIHPVNAQEPKGLNGTPSIDVLAGVVDSKLILSMRNAALCYSIEALLADTLTVEWIAIPTSNDSDAPQGRPFLTTTGYYFPFTKKLVHVNLRTGKFEEWRWPEKDNKEQEKPGNLLVTSEQVVVVNDQEIAGYSKWETAFANGQTRIQANPKDPAPHLALAEISFRTNHSELAQENMKQAVDLANSGAAPPGQSVADMLGRLYLTNLSFAEQLIAKSEPELRDQSRFYYEQCRATARTPEQGVEWRIRLAELAQKQQRFDEMAALYSAVLTDPALRAADYREPEGVQSAGAAAERRLTNLLQDHGKAVYQPFEAQAAALTQRATAARDLAGLQQVIDSYPNADAALSAAGVLAALYQQNQNWEDARRVLWWLQPRLKGDAQARAIGDLATVSLALKRYDSAASWADRGARQFRDFSWNDGAKTVTFADLKARILQAGGGGLEGRLPRLPRSSDNRLVMESAPLGHPLAGTQLLVPVETALALRPPDLLFVRQGNRLHIKGALTGQDLGTPVNLPRDADTVLVGATKDRAVLLQANMAVGVDLNTHATWTQPLAAPNVPASPVNRSGVNTVRINANGAQQIAIVNGNIVVNGVQIGAAELTTLIDDRGQIVVPSAGGDPASIRRTAFRILGNSARFTTARILNGNLLILAGNQIDAYNIETGKPAWTGPGAAAVSARLPNGNASCFVGNEDLVVAQIDNPSGGGATFCAFDAQTGKPAKQLKLDNERVLWRALGDDGTLYVATDRAVSAYDLMSEKNLVWQNKDDWSRFGAASALTLDGVIVVTGSNEVQCLSLDSGDNRWPHEPRVPTATLGLELLSSPTTASTLRSTIVGDLVVFQSSDGCVAFKSQPQIIDLRKARSDFPDSPQRAWQATSLRDAPPRQSLQASDAFLVERLSGGTQTARRDQFIFREVLGGKMEFRAYSLGASTLNEDPVIRSWQVVDGGIALETVRTNALGANAPGNLYLWRAQAKP
jgi:outer membrane protein assembly factor BamB